MKYTVIHLVDGQRVSCNRNVDFDDLEYVTELDGVVLLSFKYDLKGEGQAMDVRRDAHGVTVVVAHEEI